jgi:HPt (histidine-containing phosphotransfer) domain-containing protein
MLLHWLPMRAAGFGEGRKAGDGAKAQPAARQPQAPRVELGQQPGGAPVPEQEVLDPEVLEELFEIMEEDALALLQEYLDNAWELLKEIERAVGEGDAGALMLPAHSLKSSSANVGAMQVSVLAKRLELMGREDNMGKAPACWKKMQAAYFRAKKSLKEIIQRGGL